MNNSIFLLIAVATLLVVIQSDLTPQELTQRAYNAQKEWREVWDDLIKKGGIEKTTHPNQGGTLVDMYKLNGDVIKGMKLSDAFKLLQSWNIHGAEDTKQKFFQLNIAGEDYIFRLKRDANNQIMVYDEAGKAPEYNDIFKYFDSQISQGYVTQKDIAEQILKACEEEVGSQSDFTFSGAAKLKKNIRDLMVVGQVAEPATMSEEYFKRVDSLFLETRQFKMETISQYWNNEIKANFQRQNREIYSKDESYEELFKLCEELRTTTDPDKAEELKNRISEKIPVPSEAFFEALENAATGTNQEKKIREEIEKLGVEDPSSDEYKIIKDQIEILKKNPDPSEERENAKKKIKDTLPSLTDDYFDTLTASSGSAEEEAELLAQRYWKKKINAKLFSESGKKISKFGRIPGQDYIFRKAIQEVAKGVSNFKKVFTELFPIHLKGGAGKGRVRLWGDAFDVEEEVKASEERLKKLKIDNDIKGSAVGAGDSTAVQDAVKGAVGGACGGSRVVFFEGREFCENKKMKIIQDSFDWTDEGLSFETIDEDGIKTKHEANIKMDDLGLPKYIKESVANFDEMGIHREEDNEPNPPSDVEGVNKAVGIYGAVVSILSSAKYLQRGEYGKAAFSATQAVYTLGSLTGLNRVIEEATQKAFAKLMGFSADKAGVEKLMEKMMEVATKAVGETTARVLDRLAGSLPLIGIAFDLYFVAEDIKDLQDKSSQTPLGLKIAHLVLDYAILDLTIVESLVPEVTPFTEPAILALTMIRISIDDFYMDIKRELTQAKGKSFGDKFWAFIKGYKEGVVDVFTLGLFSQLVSLQQQVDFDHEFLQNMTDPEKYFEYRFNNSQGDLDFTSGIVSQYGGFLNVKMHDNGSVTMVMAEVPNEDGELETIIKTFDFPNHVDEIILGVGEVKVPVYMQETAYLWMFIPIKSDDVIGDLDEHGSSRYGVYTGNKYGNTFYALQTQADPDDDDNTVMAAEKAERTPPVHYHLKQYRYRRSVQEQKEASSPVEHESGFHDIEDEVPLQQSVEITHGAASNVKAVSSSHEDYEDYAKSLERSFSVRSKTFNSPQSLMASAASDYFVFNDECDDPNAATNISKYLKSYNYNLYGKKGDDKFFLGPQQTTASGDEGADLYYIQPSGGKAIIDNFAIDEEMDTLYFNMSFSHIECTREDWDLLIGFCYSHNVRLKNWFNTDKNEFYRHIHILTNDGIIMEATGSDVDLETMGRYSISCNAVVVDKTGSEEGQTVELVDRLSNVKDVFGSNYSDSIIGNELENLIVPGTGDDTMEGKGGKDVYMIDKEDGVDTINNYAEDFEEDTILFSVPYVNIQTVKDGDDLHLYDSDHPSHVLTVLNWFSSSLYQHAVFMSSDYVQFTVELDTDNSALLVALTIDLTKYEHGVVIDLTDSSNNVNYTINGEVMNDVTVILDSKHDDRLIGNTLGNFLTCTGGKGYLKGNAGKDTFVADENCVELTIDNYDDVKDLDMLLFRCSYEDLQLYAPPGTLDLRITCTIDNRQFHVFLINWFEGIEYQHLYIKTSDLITATLPSDREEYDQPNNGLYPVEIQVDEGCNGERMEIDLRSKEFEKVERIEAGNKTCSYTIYGNSIANYIDPGPGDPYQYQHLEGGNGTDTYVLGHDYGLYTVINNYAADNQTDHLQFGVIFSDIVAQREDKDMRLTSKSQNDSVQVKIIDYFEDSLHQHIVVETADNFMFRFTEQYPYIEVIMLDLSTSTFSQIVSPHENTTYKDASIIVGSKTAVNHITGGMNSKVIVCGNQSDIINGGPLEEDLVAGEGDDYVDAGDGNDRIYGQDGDDILIGGNGDDAVFGGMGGDAINGSDGYDYIVFSGVNFTGITATIQVGTGLHADAENDTYASIEHLLGTEYDDILIGNDDNNILRGFGGRDIIFPYGGYDLLHGGIGSDLYMLEEASGEKVINNFATDEALDMVSMKNYSSDRICYLYLDQDLIMNVSFDVNNQDTIGRIITGENFLELTVAYALKNSSYRHLLFFFSDVQKNIEDYTEEDHQIGPIYDQLLSGHFLHITCHSETTICINVNFTVIDEDNIAPNDKYELDLMQVTHNDTISYPLTYIYTGGNESIQLENQLSGVEYTFFGYLSSCGVSITASPLINTVTVPNPPQSLTAAGIAFDGFTITWEPPSEESDPLSGNYSYQVKILQINTTELIEFESTNDTEFTTTYLLPQTEYQVLVYSESHNTTSRHAAGMHITTDSHICNNLVNLPEPMYIHGFNRNDDGQLIATLSCIRGYKLEGEADVVCDDPNTKLPECKSIKCVLPNPGNATLLSVGFDNSTNMPLHGDLLVWMCNQHFEVSVNVTTFNSTCTNHIWVPSTSRKCKELPKCRVKPIFNGDISDTEIFVGENVTFSCDYGYALVGPMTKLCFRTYFNTLELRPTVEVGCNHTHCPSLLPQTHGRYTKDPPYYIDALVDVHCDFGYYVTNRVNVPDQEFYKCLGENWNDTIRACRTMIAVRSDVISKIRSISATFGWSFSGWNSVTMTPEYYDVGCKQIGGLRYESTVGSMMQCSRIASLTNGPSNYEGILTISDKEEVGGISYVCVDSPDAVSGVCDLVGLGQHTASIYHTSVAITTTKILKPSTNAHGNLTDYVQSCTARISCKARCDPLELLNGEVHCFNEEPLEGDMCTLNCRTGFYLTGNVIRRCTSNGWSGSHTFCDGEMWKTEIELVTRQNSHMDRLELAKTVYNHLWQMFSSTGIIYWHVIVYDDVTGGGKHQVIGHDYHHLFRHYGNNIVVLRMLFPRRYDRGDPEDLPGDLLKAYEPHFDGKHIDAELTAHATWDNLPHQGIDPWGLFILRDGIAYGSYGDVTPRVSYVKLPSNQGISVVMGESFL